MQNILFIGPGFVNYDPYILNELKTRGCTHYFCYSYLYYFHPYILSLLQKLNQGKLIDRINNYYIERNIKRFRTYKYDVIFIIKGDYLKDSHLHELRNNSPNAVIKTYLWDTVDRMRNIEILKTYSNAIYSFDTNDCLNENFIFRPLFYCEKQKQCNIDYDVSFVGANHSNRLKNLVTLKNVFIKTGLRYKICVPYGILKFYIEKFIKYTFPNDYIDLISLHNISYNQYLDITSRSKVIIDLPYPGQSGLTIRTIEALALGKKVVTTNNCIKHYADIPEDMYLIIDFNNLNTQEIVDFIRKDIPNFVLPERYSVSGFVNDILE